MIWLLVAPPLAWCLAALWLDWSGHRGRIPDHADVLIVPGCAVRRDGTPSGALQRRTLHAVSLWKGKHAPTIILTGGVGRFPPSEAEAAASVAGVNGVPIGALLLEDQSTTTAENARLAAQLLPNPSALSVIVVTDCYHTWRCKRLFGRHFGCVYATGSQPPLRQRVRGGLREVGSIILMSARHTMNGMH